MAEKTVPWWRRALNFALDGIRAGFGLFSRQAKLEPPQEPPSTENLEEILIEKMVLPQPIPNPDDAVAKIAIQTESQPVAKAGTQEPEASLAPVLEPFLEEANAAAVELDVEVNGELEPAEKTEIAPDEIRAEAEQALAAAEEPIALKGAEAGRPIIEDFAAEGLAAATEEGMPGEGPAEDVTEAEAPVEFEANSARLEPGLDLEAVVFSTLQSPPESEKEFFGTSAVEADSADAAIEEQPSPAEIDAEIAEIIAPGPVAPILEADNSAAEPLSELANEAATEPESAVEDAPADELVAEAESVPEGDAALEQEAEASPDTVTVPEAEDTMDLPTTASAPRAESMASEVETAGVALDADEAAGSSAELELEAPSIESKVDEAISEVVLAAEALQVPLTEEPELPSEPCADPAAVAKGAEDGSQTDGVEQVDVQADEVAQGDEAPVEPVAVSAPEPQTASVLAMKGESRMEDPSPLVAATETPDQPAIEAENFPALEAASEPVEEMDAEPVAAAEGLATADGLTEPSPAEGQVSSSEPVAEAPDLAVIAPAAETAAPALATAPPPIDEKAAARLAARQKRLNEAGEESPFSVMVDHVYDGPLDLLLDLIRKQDIDIYDIPIAKITAQFLAYVNQLKAGDVDVAGEFIYTASLLIHIKSKMLLPRAPSGPDDTPEDPRRELVERLLEHERFKNAAQMLQQKQMLEAASWSNPGIQEFKDDTGAEPEIAADTVDLVRIFRDVLERARTRPVIDMNEDQVTVGQMIQFLGRRLTMEDKPVALRRLLSHTRSERALIAMFLALLELVRLQAILLRQDRAFSEIFIKKHTGFDAVMNEGLVNARDDWR